MGNFTHYNKNTGQSVVDIALLSDALFPVMNDFQVMPQDTYSDHCKIVLTLKNHRPTPKLGDYNWCSLSPEFKWNEDTSPQKYSDALNTEESGALIEECKQRIQAGLIESSGSLLQKIFLKAADSSLEKKALIPLRKI